MYDELNKELNKLWASDILNYEFDIIKNTVNLSLKTHEGENFDLHLEKRLIFKDVSVLQFLNHFSVNSRKHIHEYDYLELTGIGVLDKPIIISLFNPVTGQSNEVKANIFIEIHEEIIYMEVGVIDIDGILFYL